MSSSVATRRNGQVSPLATGMGDSAWDVMVAQARVLVNSGFLPSSIKTPEQAIAIMMTGEELRIGKMLALRSITVIQGKPTLSADLMASLVHREIDRHKDGVFDVQPPTPTECTVRFRRWGKEKVKTYTYTIQDAVRAGLASNDNYKKHPASMLRARATAHAARMEFPDVIAGLYAPEEVDAEDDGPAWERPGVTAEVVDGPALPDHWGEVESVDDSGEIVVETLEMVREDIKHVAGQLNLSPEKVQGFAKSIEANYRTLDGALQLRSALWGMLPEEQDGEAGDDPYTRQ